MNFTHRNGIKDDARFPITLLRTAMKSDRHWRNCLNEILDYHVYRAMLCYIDEEMGLDIEDEEFTTHDIIEDDAIRYISEHFGISSRRPIDNFLEYWQADYDGVPFTRIKTQTLFQFRDKKKTTNEKLQFLAFAAIKSIVGLKKYQKTTRKHILARMAGYTRRDLTPSRLPVEIEKLDARNNYHFRKLIDMLRVNWGVHYYPIHGEKGFYVSSPKGVELEDMVEQIERKRMRNKVAKMNNTQNDIVKRVIRRVQQSDYEQDNDDF